MTDPSSDAQEKKSQVQDYFSRTAENYVESISHRSGNDLARLIALGEWDQRQTALDIATGGGHTALAVAPHVQSMIASDLTPRMLEKARAFIISQGITNAFFVVADAEQLPFLDATFDRVTCRIAPHHFPNVATAVRETARVLKPGGLFLLIDSIAPSDPMLDQFDNLVEKWRDPSHGRTYTAQEWFSFFAQAGLHIEHRELFRRTHNFADWTRRSQLADEPKAELEKFILENHPAIQQYFEIKRSSDGRLESFSMDFILLKGRKT